MKTRDTRTDSGQYYPGGKVIPRQPVRPGGGSDADAVHYYAETRTDDQKAQARQNIGAAASGDIPILDPSMTTTKPTEDGHGLTKRGIWSWVKSLLPNWLTSNYAEPATEESVNQKYTKPSDGIPESDLNANVQSSLNKADTASQPGHTHPQSQVTGLADALEAKRDKTDDYVYTGHYPDEHMRFVLSGNGVHAGEYLWSDQFSAWSGPTAIISRVPDSETKFEFHYEGETVDFDIEGSFTFDGVRYNSSFVPGVKYANEMQLAGKVDAVVGKGLSQNDYTDADKTKVAKVKDKADEFTQWVPDSSAPSELTGQPKYIESEGFWGWIGSDGRSWIGAGGVDAIVSEFRNSADTFTATRKRVLRTGDALTPGLSAQGVPTDENVRDLFSEFNTSLMGLLPYPLNTDGTIKDRAINVVTSGAFVIPQGFHDLLIRYTGVPTSITFSGTDAGIANVGDDLPTETGDYLITVTRTKSAECYIRIVTLEARA